MGFRHWPFGLICSSAMKWDRGNSAPVLKRSYDFNLVRPKKVGLNEGSNAQLVPVVCHSGRVRVSSSLRYELVGRLGFEPRTPGLKVRCSGQLSYRPTVGGATAVAGFMIAMFAFVRQQMDRQRENCKSPYGSSLGQFGGGSHSLLLENCTCAILSVRREAFSRSDVTVRGTGSRQPGRLSASGL